MRVNNCTAVEILTQNLGSSVRIVNVPWCLGERSQEMSLETQNKTNLETTARGEEIGKITSFGIRQNGNSQTFQILKCPVTTQYKVRRSILRTASQVPTFQYREST